MKKRKVIYANFHQPLFIPHLGHLGVTLPSGSKTLPDLVMHTEEEGLAISAKGADLLIPYGNIVLMRLGEEYNPADLPKANPPKP